jgi:hypothetical protein
MIEILSHPLSYLLIAAASMTATLILLPPASLLRAVRKGLFFKTAIALDETSIKNGKLRATWLNGLLQNPLLWKRQSILATMNIMLLIPLATTYSYHKAITHFKTSAAAQTEVRTPEN